MTYESAQVMDLLKEATAEQHRDAERRRLQQDLVAGRVSVTLYAAWLGQMLLLHDALWQEIVRRGGAHPAIGVVVRDEGRHVANLRSDLTALGTDPARVAPIGATGRAIAALQVISAADPVALLGHNYVLEGSMNGNKYLARALARTLQTSALAYLDPYGEEQRGVWAGYRERMNAAGLDQAQAERVVAAARAMFGYIAALSDELMGDPVTA